MIMWISRTVFNPRQPCASTVASISVNFVITKKNQWFIIYLMDDAVLGQLLVLCSLVSFVEEFHFSARDQLRPGHRGLIIRQSIYK